MSGSGSISMLDAYPQLFDDSSSHSIDAHYYYSNGWAMRRIILEKPEIHVDIASQAIFSNALASVLPVIYLDYRALHIDLDLEVIQGSILKIPLSSNTLPSLSCLHVVEHIGLGRYGDALDPDGTVKAIRELARTISRGGNLFLAAPIGRHRTAFNAHRIFSPGYIPDLLPEFILVEFSAVTDGGKFQENAEMRDFNDSEYSCGLYWFKRDVGLVS
jgi:hypothetical protein